MASILCPDPTITLLDAFGPEDVVFCVRSFYFCSFAILLRYSPIRSVLD
jgi:hypothetical protein